MVWVMKMFPILLEILATQLYVCHIYRNLHLKLVHFTIGVLDLYKNMLFEKCCEVVSVYTRCTWSGVGRLAGLKA